MVRTIDGVFLETLHCTAKLVPTFKKSIEVEALRLDWGNVSRAAREASERIAIGRGMVEDAESRKRDKRA